MSQQKEIACDCVTNILIGNFKRKVATIWKLLRIVLLLFVVFVPDFRFLPFRQSRSHIFQEDAEVEMYCNVNAHHTLMAIY